MELEIKGADDVREERKGRKSEAKGCEKEG